MRVARQPAPAGEVREAEDDRIEEARRRAAAQFDWLLAYPPPAMDDDAPMLIAWAERSVERFHDPTTADSARGYIAVGLLKVFGELKEFETRAKRDPDGALVYAGIAGDVPWTSARPHSVDELPLFTSESVERWRRVADFAASDEEAEETRGRRRPPPRKPVRVASPMGRDVEITRSPNSITFPKGKDMSAASDEGQRELIWLHVASTHPGLTGDQISWAVSQLGLVKGDGSRRLVQSWVDDFEAAKPGDRITLTSDRAFEQDVSNALLHVPTERDLLVEGYRQGVLDARGGLMLAYATLAVGTLALGGGAGIGYLGSLGGEVAMSSIAAGGGTFLGGEAASFGSFAAAGGRFLATDLYLNAPAYFQAGMLYSGAVLSGVGFGEQINRIRAQGWHRWELGEAAANLLPLAEGSVPYLGGGRRQSGSSGTPPGAGGEPVEPDLLITPARRDPVSGRVTASVTDLKSGRTFDANVDGTTRVGEIVDRRSRAVVGIIDGDEIRPPAAANLPSGEPQVVPPTAAPAAPSPTATTATAPAPAPQPAPTAPAPTVASPGAPGRPGTVTVDDAMHNGLVRPGGRLEGVLRGMQTEFEAAPPTSMKEGLRLVQRVTARLGLASGIREQTTADVIVLKNVGGNKTYLRTTGEITVVDKDGNVVLHLIP
jgi:hypothetical protein